MRNIITHGSILFLILLGFIFGYTLSSISLLLIEILFLSIIELIYQNGSFLRYFYLKKVYTDWGIFYTGVFGRYLFIYKDISIYFLLIGSIDIRYSYINNSDKLKEKIIEEIKNSRYLKSRIDTIEDKKRSYEIKKILNNWSGFSNKQLERDYKINKLL